MPYAWVITKSYIEDSAPQGKPTTVDVTGPRRATDEQIALARSQGVAFAMYDDDGELYYRGKFWGEDSSVASLSEDAFGPLEDYGTPNAGCTEIRYRAPDGTYQEL